MNSLLIGPDALLLAPECMPFTVALGLMVGLGLLEGVGLLVGMGFSHLLDSALPDVDLHLDTDTEAPGHAPGDAGAHGTLARLLGWLNLGRVPALIVLVVLLLTFGFAGLAAQEAVRALRGALLPTPAAVLVALTIAAPLTRLLTGALARVMPRDETEAVSRSSFVGSGAILLQAEARKGGPAQAKLRDAYGQTHYVMVEPEDAERVLAPHSEVLIVRQAGALFTAVPKPD